MVNQVFMTLDLTSGSLEEKIAYSTSLDNTGTGFMMMIQMDLELEQYLLNRI